MVAAIIGSGESAESAKDAEGNKDGEGEGMPVVIVVDTNIWLDMLVFDDPRTRRLASLLQPASVVQPLSSPEMRAELADVITRPQFRLDAARQAALLARYDTHVTCAPPALDCRLPCRDPDDRKFLDLAVGRRTTWLLSRDRALLAARKLAWNRFAVRIGQVADFYNWLDEPASR
jgi:putative PIN family toxin of toxin-antitoxin system